MTPGERSELTRIVERVKAINAEVQDLREETRGLVNAAWVKIGVQPKVIKQLVKESAWDEVQREAQRQHEEELDNCRAALGLLADLPLGQAAQAGYSPSDPLLRKDGSVKPGMNADGTRRGRGRPPGAKNKPKLATSNGQDVPPVGDPPVPDIPEVSAA